MIKIMLVFLLVLSGCSKIPENKEKYQGIADIVYDDDGSPIPPLNTTIKLTMFDEQTFEKNFALINTMIQYYHPLFDGYHDFHAINNVKTINEASGSNEAVKVDKELFDVIFEAIKITKLSEGKFNLTIDPLYQVYQPLFSQFPIVHEDPNHEEIKKAQACVVSPDKVDEIIELDAKNNTVKINQYDGCEKKVQITLGAISKGYITDKIVEKLNETNKPYLLDVGSSNIYGVNDVAWKVGVRSPYNKVSFSYPIQLQSKMALSTSGDDQNYYLKENEDGSQIVRSHILDATLGYSPNYYRNVTVLCDNNMLADAMSTILFTCQDNDEILKYIHIFEKNYATNFEYGLIKEISAENKQLELIKSKGYDQYIMSEYISTDIVKQEILYE